MKSFFLLFLYCTDTDCDGVDLESPQGLGNDIPTMPEVDIHVHVGDIASSSSQRLDGPADIAKTKNLLNQLALIFHFPFLERVVGRFNLDGTNSFHGLNIQKTWILPFVSHVGFSGIAIQMMHLLRTGSVTKNMPWARKGCSQIIQLVMFTLNP